jgi:hypothetical protein
MRWTGKTSRVSHSFLEIPPFERRSFQLVLPRSKVREIAPGEALAPRSSHTESPCVG